VFHTVALLARKEQLLTPLLAFVVPIL